MTTMDCMNLDGVGGSINFPKLQETTLWETMVAALDHSCGRELTYELFKGFVCIYRTVMVVAQQEVVIPPPLCHHSEPHGLHTGLPTIGL